VQADPVCVTQQERYSIDKAGPSPLVIVPPFRDLHKRYPVKSVEEALAEGISTGQPTMPEFCFEPDQINNIIALLRSLDPRSSAP